MKMAQILGEHLRQSKIILTMKKSIIVITVIISLISWNCTKVETNRGLKQSVEKGVANINTAITRISGTTGYQMLVLTDAAAKGGDSYNDSISLNLVSGIYDFQPDTIMRNHHFSPYKLFKKTGESENMVVNLPEELVLHPKHLCFYQPTDTIPENNFTITATNYHLFYNWWNSYDYKLTAGFTVDAEDLGTMDVSSSSSSFNSHSSSSAFTFKGGYSIAAEWHDGDTTASSYSLSKDNDTLFREEVVFIWNQTHRSEKFYTLTIGDVVIKRGTEVDSIQVFLNGVLQKTAATLISDDSDEDGSVCHHRDILLTFDDGTTAKISDLIDPVKEQLFTLKDSLHSMFFAKHIVDYIGFSIYYNTH
jgi:hypothetical protein